MQINRKEFMQELNEEIQLRQLIRRGIKIIKERKHNYVSIDDSLLLKMLTEAGTDVPSEIPHTNTGINVLETLLKKIIPILEDDFKALTTEPDQRRSFRAHVVQAVKNSLTPINVIGLTDELPEKGLKEDIDIEVGVGDEEKFIPVRKQDIEGQESEEEAKADTFTIPGEDMTGRNFAYESYNKVEKNILDAYGNLQNDNDRKLFFDFLITNLKLYFDRFEDELQANLQEPTTPEYEQEKEAEAAANANIPELAGAPPMPAEEMPPPA